MTSKFHSSSLTLSKIRFKVFVSRYSRCFKGFLSRQFQITMCLIYLRSVYLTTLSIAKIIKHEMIKQSANDEVDRVHQLELVD